MLRLKFFDEIKAQLHKINIKSIDYKSVLVNIILILSVLEMNTQSVNFSSCYTENRTEILLKNYFVHV